MRVRILRLIGKRVECAMSALVLKRSTKSNRC